MPDFKFLHAADLHLDSPLRGLEADQTAPAELIRTATRRALGRMVDLAREQKVAFVVIAGDIYDGDWPDYGTGLFFANQMRRLAQDGIGVFAVHGNHDAANRMTRRLRMEHVTIFDHKRAHTAHLPELEVAIHGQSFADQAVTEDLSRLYPPPLPGLFNIGLLHTSAAGYAAHERYAPSDPARLRAHGYEYWALGHVHEREILSRDPWIVFPGNLQGRHINETGPKGVSIVTVSGRRVVSVDHHDRDVLRWARIEVDLTGAAGEAEALTRVQAALETAQNAAGTLPLAARLTLTGATAAHAALSRDGLREKVLNEAHGLNGTQNFWLEAVKLRTSPPRQQEHSGNLGQLLSGIGQLAAAPPAGLLADWPAALLAKLSEALPSDHPLRHAAEGKNLAPILERARDLLTAALTEAP